MNEDLTNFTEFVQTIVGPYEITDKKVDKNKIQLKVKGSFRHDLPVGIQKLDETIDLGESKFSLETPSALTLGALAQMGVQLEEYMFHGLFFCSLNPRCARISSLSPLSDYLVGFRTASDLVAGFHDGTYYGKKPDFTRAEVNSSDEDLAGLKTLPFVGTHEKNSVDSRVNSNVLHFSHSLTLEDIDALEQAFLKSRKDTAKRYSTELVFMDPIVEKMTQVEDYAQRSKKGVFVGYLEHVLGKYGNVSINQGFRQDFDSMMVDGKLTLEYGSFMHKGFEEDLTANILVPHLQAWHDIDKIIGRVRARYVSSGSEKD